MKKRQTYTKEFKLEAVRLLEESDKNGTEISRELDVRRNLLYKWQKELQSKGSNAFKGAGRKPADSNDKLTELQKENDKLREEVEILKKAAVDSMGHCNRCFKMLICRGLLDETYIYRRRTELCF